MQNSMLVMGQAQLYKFNSSKKAGFICSGDLWNKGTVLEVNKVLSNQLDKFNVKNESMVGQKIADFQMKLNQISIPIVNPEDLDSQT